MGGDLGFYRDNVQNQIAQARLAQSFQEEMIRRQLNSMNVYCGGAVIEKPMMLNEKLLLTKGKK